MILDDETLEALGFSAAPDLAWFHSVNRAASELDSINGRRKRYAEMSPASKELRKAASRRWYYANREKALAAQRKRDRQKRKP